MSSARSRARRLKRGGRRRRGGGARGFTLIEALVAIVILALALGVLLSAHGGGLRGAAALDEHLQARLLAQSLLAEWSRHRVFQPASQGQSGRFTWTVSVAPYAGPGASLQRDATQWTLHQLTVTVAWPPGRRVELATLRLLRVR